MNNNQALANYETVKERKKKFYQTYEDGRIIVSLEENTKDSSLMKAILYKNAMELKESLPLSTGYAQEFKGQGGFANKTSWLENCEESAVGRALDNAGFSGSNKCSREEIIQANNNKEIFAKEEKFKKLKIEYFSLLGTFFNGDIPKDEIESAKTMTYEEMNLSANELSMEIEEKEKLGEE